MLIIIMLKISVYKLRTGRKKRGKKFKITKSSQLNIKREIAVLNVSVCKVNSSKKKWLYIHKLKSIQCIKSWIWENHNSERTIFFFEKQFYIDGTDDQRSYIQKTTTHYYCYLLSLILSFILNFVFILFHMISQNSDYKPYPYICR